ncbi:MAG: TonB family protein [Candidatus Hinthialibacter antarcticus]|nr:TonB family protein [Candidatus Hinthialibacter antarcticus]
MSNRTSFIFSICFHVGLVLLLVISPQARFKPKENFVSMKLETLVPPQPQQKEQPKPPEPEPEKPKPKPKEDLDKIKEMLKKELVKTPTPTPKKKTPTPTKKPTSKPTQKPTPRPTQPQATTTPMPTPTAQVTPMPTLRPISDLLNDVINALPTEMPNAPTIQGDPEAGNYDFGSYTSRLAAYLKRNWRIPAGRRPERREYITHISFTVKKDGSIADVKLERSSGWERLDKTVVESVSKTDGFVKLPPDYQGKQVRVLYPFVLPLE